jgi:predicted metal-dependent hydrolase
MTTPMWIDVLRAVSDASGFALDHYTSTESYIPRLADDHAALIVVDGGDTVWRHWTTSPRVNAATRRIPIVVVSDDAAVRDQAQGVGADFVLGSSDLATALPGILHDHARVIDDEFRAEIANQCAQPLPPEAREAIEKFNRGEYYKQHDMLEALWMQESGPVRDLYRAILQVGIAYYQVERGNLRGALKMILRCIQWLNILPDVCQGVDVASLRADANRLRAAIDAWPDDRDALEFDRALLGKVWLVE